VLPDSGLPVPDQFWDIEVGTMHIRELADGWRAGGMLRVGSPSDQPFAALRDMTVTLLGFLTIPSGQRDAWNFSLFYSPTGQIVWPIPGVAYVFDRQMFQAEKFSGSRRDDLAIDPGVAGMFQFVWTR